MIDWLFRLLFKAEYEQIQRMKASPDCHLKTPEGMYLTDVSMWVRESAEGATLECIWAEVPATTSYKG